MASEKIDITKEQLKEEFKKLLPLTLALVEALESNVDRFNTEINDETIDQWMEEDPELKDLYEQLDKGQGRLAEFF